MNRRDFLANGLTIAGAMMLAGCRGFEAAEHRYKLAPENVLAGGYREGSCRGTRGISIRDQQSRYSPLYPLLLRLWIGWPHQQCIVLFQRQFNTRESGLRSHEPCLKYLHKHHA